MQILFLFLIIFIILGLSSICCATLVEVVQ